MRSPFLPHPVVPRRVTSIAAGAPTFAVVVLLVAGCVAAPAGTATPTPTSPPSLPAPTAVAPGSPADVPLATPSPTGSLPPVPTPGGTNEPTIVPTPRPTLPPPTPPPTRAPTPRPTRPPAPAPTAVPAALGTIAGLAHAGPTCPVAQLPPDPACADKPVAGVVITVTDAAGAAVTTVTTDADGRFSVALAPGTWTLAPQPRQGLMRTPGPETVSLAAGATVTVDFAYDTGIR